MSKALVAPGDLLGTPVDDVALVGRASLLPWMRKYATWCAAKGMLADKTRWAMAKTFCGWNLSRPAWLALEARSDFGELVETLIADDVARARAIIQEGTPEAMETHLEMMRAAKEAGDYKEAARYTIPIMDRVWAKREEGVTVNASVVLNIGGTFAKQTMTERDDEIVIESPEIVVE